MRKFREKKLIIASHNLGKIAEFKKILTPYDIELLSSRDFDLEEPVENGSTFLDNANIKALYTTSATGLPCIADDSGLCVHALNNEPGVFSARYAPTFAEAMSTVNDKLKGVTDRSAHFACTIVMAWPDTYCESFTGKVFGHIVFPPRGIRGFGYDPIFMPDGYTETFGQMDEEQKNKISHRAKAIEKFINECIK